MARLRGQLFARLSLDYFDHPKIMNLSAEAIVAHLEMIVYSRRYGTDGIVPMRFAMRFASDVLDELASNDPDAPSIIRHDDGTIEIYGYADMQETSAEIEARRQARQAAGKAGAQARWQEDGKSHSKSHSKSHGKADGKSNGKKMAETETETETDIPPISPPQGDDRATAFTRFWSAYPRKVGKKTAETKFKTALQRADAETIIAGAHRLADDPNLPEAQFIPHPSTWLNRDGWEDEPLPERHQPKTFAQQTTDNNNAALLRAVQGGGDPWSTPEEQETLRSGGRWQLGS